MQRDGEREAARVEKRWHALRKSFGMPRRSKRSPSPDPDSPQKVPSISSTPGSDLSDTDLSDPEHAPPEEPGVSLEAVELGEQFLRDATEQYNFESTLGTDADREPVGVPVAQVISEGTLESANQAEFILPVSEAIADPTPEVFSEPAQAELDLTGEAIVSASLFDQPISDQEAEEEADERQDADDMDLTLAAPLRQPVFRSDDPSDVDDARAQEIQRLLDERVRRRLRVQRLPKEGPLEPERAPEPPERRRR
jgi:hypothetical protein